MKHQPAATAALYSQRDAQLTQRDLTTRELTLRAGSYNESERSFEAVVATETVAQVFDWRSFEVIDEILVADGGEFPQRMPLLDSHNRFRSQDVIGSARQFRRDGREWVGRGYFADDSDVDKIAKRVRDGHITDVSIGYEVLSYVDIPARTKQTINGRPYEAGERTLRVTTKWRVRELSVTPIGADSAAKIRTSPGNGRTPAPILRSVSMNPRLLAYIRSLMHNPQATEEECRAHMANLKGVERTIAGILDYDQADASARTSADLAIRSLGYEPENPTQQRQEPAAAGGQAPATRTEPQNGQQAEQTPEQIRSEGARIERERQTQLREMAGDLVPAEMLTRAINEGWTVERAGPVFLQAIRDSRGTPLNGDVPGGAPAGHSRNSQTGYTRDILVAAAMHRNGIDPSQVNIRVDASGNIHRLAVNESQRAQIAEQAWQYSHVSMRDLLRMCARMDGISVHEGTSVVETLRMYNERAGGFSTNTFLNVFTTNIGAQLLAAYDQFPDSTGGGWVREADVANFLTQERARMEKGPSLLKLPRQKEADHAEFADNVESYKIARYARQFQIDDQDIIDDRFNGINPHVASEFGQAAARLRPDLVYALLLANAAMRDGTALFHANHSNLLTTNALALAGLTAARKAMMLQTENGVNLGLMLKFLLVPPALEVTALELSKSPLLITGSDVVRPAMNQLASAGFTVVPEPRLENGVVNPATGTTHSGSATTWFGATMASTAPTIEVGYRTGTGRAPQLRSGMLDRGRWGMWFDINHDIGAKALDWRGLQKSTA